MKFNCSYVHSWNTGILEDSKRLELEGAVPCLWQWQVKKVKE